MGMFVFIYIYITKAKIKESLELLDRYRSKLGKIGEINDENTHFPLIL